MCAVWEDWKNSRRRPIRRVALSGSSPPAPLSVTVIVIRACLQGEHIHRRGRGQGRACDSTTLQPADVSRASSITL